MSPVDGTIIAPGTRGSFDIVIKNDSQVNATYAIDYTVTNTNNIPVKFSVDGTNWFDDINYLDVRSVAINMGATATVTVKESTAILRIQLSVLQLPLLLPFQLL